MSMQGDPGAGIGGMPPTPDQIDELLDGAGDGSDTELADEGPGGSGDPEALGEEREEYPDPESYPSSQGAGADVTDGETPDADLDTSVVE